MSDIATVKVWLHRSAAALLMTVLAGFSSVAQPQTAGASTRSGGDKASASTSVQKADQKTDTSAQAEEVPSYPLSSDTTAAERKGKEFALPLSDLVGENQPVMLRGVSSALRFKMPVPALWQPNQVLLGLSGSFSGALIDTSQLIIKVNEHVVQQFSLQSNSNDFQQVVQIPANLLRSGFNDIEIGVTQYSGRASCESAASPELWTQLDLTRSKLMITAQPKPVPERLDNMDALFDKADWQPRPVVPVMTATAEPSSGEISAMGLIAQGVGDRYDTLPVSLTQRQLPASLAELSRGIPEGSRGVVLLGTYAALGSYLKDLDVPQKSSPVIAIRALPNDPTRFVLVLAAETDTELVNVATAFAMRQVPWPDNPWVAVNNVMVPDGETASSGSTIASPAAGISPLKAMGFRTTTYTGQDEQGSTLRFWNNNWRGRIMVRVHLGYASGMAPQSALNVLTNGTLHGSIPLNNPDGGRYYNYAVSIPAGAIKPGWNTLEFQPVLLPVTNGEECPPSGENLAVTLYDDTVVEKTGGKELKQSDLAVLAGLGASHADGRMGKGIALHLTDAQAPTLSAGMTMMAKMAQVANGPLLHTWFGVGEQSGMEHHLWVGPYAALPEQVKQVMPAAEQVKIQVPVMEIAPVPVPSDGGLVNTLQEAMNFKGKAQPDYKVAEVDMSGPLSENSFAYTRRQADQTYTVFTASSASQLFDGINGIVEADQWNQLQGNLAYWSSGGSPVSVASSADEPFAAYGLRGGLGMWLSHYPWIALAGLVATVLLLVLLTRMTLRFYRRRRN